MQMYQKTPLERTTFRDSEELGGYRGMHDVDNIDHKLTPFRTFSIRRRSTALALFQEVIYNGHTDLLLDVSEDDIAQSHVAVRVKGYHSSYHAL